jgi:hypothetical protein
VKVREILERSVEHLPYDAEMWLALGQFVAYVAPPSYLDDKPEIAAAWRRDGLRYLSRAAELCGSDANICWQALGGASMLARHGEREASIRFLQRTYAVTDDEDLKKEILGRLEKLMVERDLQAYKGRDEAFRSLVEGELPYLTRDEALVLGPPPSPAHCAGPHHPDEPDCAIDWRQWSERYQRAQQNQ